MGEQIYPFQPFLDALKDKDASLFTKLCWLPPGEFWREWKKVYPEDFADGDLSLVSPSSIVPRKPTLENWDERRAKFGKTQSPEQLPTHPKV